MRIIGQPPAGPGGRPLPLSAAIEVGAGVSIIQSAAIMEYLEELHPEPPLGGRNEAERRRIDTQAQLINDVMTYRKVSVATTLRYLAPYQKIRASEASLVCDALDWSRFEQISLVWIAEASWRRTSRRSPTSCCT